MCHGSRDTIDTEGTLKASSWTEKKNYLRGFGIGPQPSSTSDSAARARDKHIEAMRAEIKVLREERQRDHEELMMEKEHQRDRKEIIGRERR
ncbi:hypothetical protein ACSBR2_008119 [Camellia fascicularis]